MPTQALPWYETVLIYAGIPLLIFLVLAAFTLLPHRNRGKTIYRPGQPWNHQPVWYEPHPEISGVDAHGGGHGAGHGAGHAELEHPGAVAAALAIGERPHEPVEEFDLAVSGPQRTAAGGARGTW